MTLNVLEINEAERDTTRKHQLSSEHSRDRFNKKVNVTEHLQSKEFKANSRLSKIMHHSLLILLHERNSYCDCISERKLTRTFRFLKTEKLIISRKSAKDLRTTDNFGDFGFLSSSFALLAANFMDENT